MFDISNIDKDFKINFKIPEDTEFYDCFSDPIKIHGLYLDNDENVFTRLPESFMERNDINNGIKYLMHDTAGGRIRFATDSPYVAVVVELLHVMNMMHMPPTGHSGMDVYTCKIGESNFTYKKTFMPKATMEDGDRIYSGLCEFGAYDDYKNHEVMLNMPLYNGLVSVKVGIKKGCSLFAPAPYKDYKPIYFYGGSTNQGGCASRPGNTHAAYISRELNIDYVNLGFSGSAKGEQEIAEYIASCDLSALVISYDSNAPTNEHLRNTHYPFYKTIRDKHPDIPIFVMSFPGYNKRHAFQFFNMSIPARDIIEGNHIIMQTYMRAVSEGDENIYYIDGETVYGTENQDFCTVDGCHPNDHGFYLWGKAILSPLKRALNLF